MTCFLLCYRMRTKSKVEGLTIVGGVDLEDQGVGLEEVAIRTAVSGVAEAVSGVAEVAIEAVSGVAEMANLSGEEEDEEVAILKTGDLGAAMTTGVEAGSGAEVVPGAVSITENHSIQHHKIKRSPLMIKY